MSDDDDALFDEEDLAAEADKILSNQSRRRTSSICAIIYGKEDTLKSGIAMDCRSKAQIANHEQVIVVDLDDANEPLWTEHYDESPDIKIIHPLKWMTNDDKLEVDYDKTMQFINMVIARLNNRIQAGEKIAAIVFDGVNRLLDTSELQMRVEKELEVDEGVHFAFWRKRNQFFYDVITATKSLQCAKYFITHEKTYQKKKTGADGTEKVIKEWEDGDWHRKIPNMMWQKVHCTKEENPDSTASYRAQILKFKGAPNLVMQEFETMTVENGKATFYGLPELRDKVNIEKRRN